jgi:hypothetical protein
MARIMMCLDHGDRQLAPEWVIIILLFWIDCMSTFLVKNGVFPAIAIHSKPFSLARDYYGFGLFHRNPIQQECVNTKAVGIVCILFLSKGMLAKMLK